MINNPLQQKIDKIAEALRQLGHEGEQVAEKELRKDALVDLAYLSGWVKGVYDAFPKESE